jgi:cell shape-determining protein MreC
MSYRRDNQGKQQWLNTFILIGVIVLVILLLTLTPLSRIFTRVSHRTGSALWASRDVITQQASVVHALATESRASLLEKNEILTQENNFLKGKLFDLKRLQDENQTLRALLNAPSVDERVVATARILSAPSQSFYDGLVIEVERDTVKVGDIVTAYGTVVLGEVVEVFAKTAKVVLYASSGYENNVLVPAYDVNVIATGHGAGNFRLEMPRDTEIREGSQVLDQATQKIIATIQASMYDPREPFQTVLARSPVNIQHLSWVQLLRP